MCRCLHAVIAAFFFIEKKEKREKKTQRKGLETGMLSEATGRLEAAATERAGSSAH